MKKFNFWYNFLIIDSFAVIAVGIFISLFKETPLFIIFNAPIDPAFWSSRIIDPGTLRFKGFAYSLLGAVMTAWGVQIYFILKYAFRKKEKWSWWAIAVSLAVWFIIDESFSIAYGVYFNAAFNLLFLTAILIPLLKTKELIIKNKKK